MSIYDDLKPVVTSLMSEFKQGTVSLVAITPGSGPADNPGEATEVIHALNATVRGVSFKYVKDGFANSTDLEVTCSVVEDVTPSINDLIVIDDVRYKIVKDMSVPASGSRVAWKFLVRK